MASRGARILRSIFTLAIVMGLVVAAGWWGLSFARQAGIIGPTVVPQEYRAVIREAAKRCPQVPVNVFAAQIASESAWDPQARSSAGAQGIAQFMPAVWEQYGLDGNNDGKVSIWDPSDAIHSAAELNCVNRALVKGASGNRLQNTLAAYNAGYGAVLKYDGVPPFPETENYLRKIMATAKTIEY